MNKERTYFYLIKEGDLSGLRWALESDPSGYRATPYGQTLALIAVLENQMEILKFLIENGADVQKGDDKGFTPLHAAALENNLDAARIILEAGAQVNIEDNFGNTPLSKAVYSYRGNPSMVSLLLKFGANPLHKNKSGVSPRDFAEETRKVEILNLFGGRH